MNKQISLQSFRNRRERRWVGLGGLASGLALVVSGLHGVAPVAAQTVSVPTIQVEDRGFGLDNRGIGDLVDDIRQQDRQLEVGDDRLTVEVEQQVETGDVRQEDRAAEVGDVRQEDRAAEVDDDRLMPQAEVGDVRQEDRAAETGDDRLTRPVEQQVQIGDVRQEDRAAEIGDVRQEDRPAPTMSSGSSSSTTVSTTTNRSATSSSSAPAKSGGSTSGSGGHGGGHDDGGAHH
jgi:hypothetical protein